MKWTLGVIVASVIVLGLIFAFRDNLSGGSTTVSSAKGTRYELDRTTADLGKMPVSDVRSAIFKLKNIDTEPINLKNFATSCNCTDALVRIGGQESPTFNMTMHMSSASAQWNADLPPGETAEIELIYMPSKMPVYGAVSRYLDFIAGGKKEKLTITATVE